MNRIKDKLIQQRILKYQKHQEKFTKHGFNYEIARELIPLIQLSVWDMFGLFRLAKRIPDGGLYLEIGAKWGGSLRCVLHGSKVAGRRIRLIAIESVPNREFTRFCRENDICFIKGYSENVPYKIENVSVDLLFIDGPHGFAQVRQDLQSYWPKVKKGGTVAGHDHEARFPGVEQAVKEFFGRGYEILPHSTIWVKEKNATD